MPGKTHLRTVYRSLGITDGAHPESSLVADPTGNLYGTTLDGGMRAPSGQCGGGCGTVFELTPPAPGSGGRWTEIVLYRFQGFSNGDGSNPDSPLILDTAGNLYGTTISGGSSCDCGTVFELSPPAAPGGTWTEAVLYRFEVDILAAKTPLLLDSQGNLYGENSGGGVDDGSIYQLTPPSSQGGSWIYNLLYTFPIDGLLGASPQGGLAQDLNGNLYGAAALDGNCTVGSAGCGLIFELVRPATQGGAWTEQVNQFTGVNGDGMNPNTVAFHEGSLYGTTQNSGATSYFTGTIFKLSPPATEGEPWKETVLYAFDCSNGFGCYPQWGVIFDKAGNLYTTLSNAQGAGALADIFELSPPATKGGDWTPKVVYGFTNGNYGGVLIVSGVIFDKGKGLYGATSPGGTAEKGLVFEVLP